MPGRHRKHPEIRRLEGNPGKRPIDDLLIVAEGEPFAPDHLDDEATACLEMIARHMPPGVYATVDTYVLSAFATAWAIHRRASLELQAQALVVRGAKGGEVANPFVAIVNSQARIMASLASRLCLDPIARMALRVPDAKRPRSKFDGLLGLRPEPSPKLN